MVTITDKKYCEKDSELEANAMETGGRITDLKEGLTSILTRLSALGGCNVWILPKS